MSSYDEMLNNVRRLISVEFELFIHAYPGIYFERPIYEDINEITNEIVTLYLVKRTKYNISECARISKKNRDTITRMLKRFDIRRDNFLEK